MILAIALNTFREAIRDRVLYLLLVFSLLLIGASRLFSLMTVGNEERLIKDMGLSAISIFGVLTAVFVGVSLVFKEIERRTVYTLLVTPIRRWEFIVGKFVGLLSVLSVNLILMTLALMALLVWRDVSPWFVLPAVFLIFLELAIITAFALFFSSLTNPILAAVWTFGTYVAGHLSWSLRLLQDRLPEGPGRLIAEGVYWVLPNLEHLNIKAEVVNGIALEPGFYPWAVAYGSAYAICIVFLACLVFQRKEFK
jgi:ABC-type transport system involved in multi-copper enzyme maturation permease subunit